MLKIIKVPDLGETPARVHRPSGTVFLNMRLWPEIPANVQRVILAHEEGHFALQTPNEFEADEYAFHKIALSEPYSLKSLLAAVTLHLDIENNEQHKQRALKQIKRIIQKDAENGNKNAAKILQHMNSTTSVLKAQLRAQFPQATEEEITLALMYAISLKEATSGYSNAKGNFFKRFFDKAGDKFRKVADSPIFTGIVSAAGMAVGIPPAATTAGITLLNEKSKANVAKVQMQRDAANRAEIEARSMAGNITPGNIEPVQSLPDPVLANTAPVYYNTPPQMGTMQTAPETPKKGVPLAVWIGVGVVLVGLVLFFALRKK